MTSTSQLCAGAKLSKTNLKASWLKLNHDSGCDAKVVQNINQPKCRFFSVCHSAPKTGWKQAVDSCRAHVKAIGPSEEEMPIASVNEGHACGRDDNNKRKRNCRTRDICTVSDVLSAHAPAKGGNAKQFATMTKTATGVDLKNGQANLAVEQCSHDTAQAHIGQHFWLPSLLQAHKESDPDGSFELEMTLCTWNENLKQFCRCHVCLSIAKQIWSCAGIRMLVCDGTFTRNNCFKHIVLISTACDANNQIVTQAFATVEVENADNWVWFKEQLEVDFPGMTMWMSDADKGIKSNAFALSVSQSTDEFMLSRCARHLSGNCQENCEGTMNETHKTMITELAKSFTWDVHSRHLEKIRTTNEEWATHLDGQKEEFVMAFFLDNGTRRWGKVTSDGTETINGVFGEARSLPIVCLIEHIVKCQRQKCHERHSQASKWSEEGERTTEHCRHMQQKLANEASKRTVEVIEDNNPLHRARVQSNFNAPITGHVEVAVNLNTRSSK